MRIVLQKVLKSTVASVEKGTIAGTIGKGIMILLGVTHTDTKEITKKFAEKVLKLRLWDSLNGEKRWDTNVVENKLEIIVVSQFTLYGMLKGNKPDFHHASESKDALIVYNDFISELTKSYDASKIAHGAFGEYMNIDMICDGPTTILMDSDKPAE